MQKDRKPRIQRAGVAASQDEAVPPVSAPPTRSATSERGQAVVVYARRFMIAALRDRALAIGADPRDTADERLRKRLLVTVALIILPVAFVWGCLYWAVGEPAVALTPWEIGRASCRERV